MGYLLSRCPWTVTWWVKLGCERSDCLYANLGVQSLEAAVSALEEHARKLLGVASRHLAELQREPIEQVTAGARPREQRAEAGGRAERGPQPAARQQPPVDERLHRVVLV